MNNCKELLEQTEKMRKMQKDYFRAPSKEKVIACKAQEEAVDRLIRTIRSTQTKLEI